MLGLLAVGAPGTDVHVALGRRAAVGRIGVALVDDGQALAGVEVSSVATTARVEASTRRRPPLESVLSSRSPTASADCGFISTPAASRPFHTTTWPSVARGKWAAGGERATHEPTKPDCNGGATVHGHVPGQATVPAAAGTSRDYSAARHGHMPVGERAAAGIRAGVGTGDRHGRPVEMRGARGPRHAPG